jgi:hypothetical protein
MRSRTGSHIVQPLTNFLSTAIDAMRLCSRVLALSGLILCATQARADDTSDSNSSNNPVEPKLFNLVHGYYLRSSAIMQFNTYSHADVVPIGLGAGKVIKLNGGYVLNVYAEAQPSVYRAGVGAPNFQAFTGIKLQFPPSLTSGLNF